MPPIFQEDTVMPKNTPKKTGRNDDNVHDRSHPASPASEVAEAGAVADAPPPPPPAATSEERAETPPPPPPAPHDDDSDESTRVRASAEPSNPIASALAAAPSIADEATTLAAYLNVLEDNDFPDFLKRNKGALIAGIQSSTNFFILMQQLTENKKSAAYETIKDHLPTLIQTAQDFYNIISHLTPEQSTEVYTTLGSEKLLNFIHDTNDFYLVLSLLPYQGHCELYEALKLKYQNLEFIQNKEDLIQALRVLLPRQCGEVFDILKSAGKLDTFIANKNDFITLLKNLSPEKYSAICDVIGSELIQNKEDLIALNDSLSDVQFEAIVKAIKNHVNLNKIIPDVAAFKNVLINLRGKEKFSSLCKTLKGEIPRLIPDAKHFATLLSILYSDGRVTAFNIFKENLNHIIHSKQEVETILHTMAMRSPLRAKMEAHFNALLQKKQTEQAQQFTALKDNITQNPEAINTLSDSEKNNTILYLTYNHATDDDYALLAKKDRHGKTLKEILFQHANAHQDNPELAKAFVILSLKRYCDRVAQIEKTGTGDYKDFQLFATSRSRSRNINRDLAEKLIASLESGDSLETVFTEQAIHEKRDAIRKEKHKNQQGPFERKGVWSAELNKIFQTARQWGKPESKAKQLRP